MNLNGITLGNRMQAAPQVKANRNSFGFGSAEKQLSRDVIETVKSQLPKNNFTPLGLLKTIIEHKIPPKKIDDICFIENAASEVKKRHDFPSSLMPLDAMI